MNYAFVDEEINKVTPKGHMVSLELFTGLRFPNDAALPAFAAMPAQSRFLRKARSQLQGWLA
jgi:hypothetical protein